MSFFTEKFRRSKDKIMNSYAIWRIKPTDRESHGYNETDRILLTFDDFADKDTVKSFLEILAKENVKAAFFLVGEWARQNPDMVKAARDAGHWVGNHTYMHRNLGKLSASEVAQEIGSDVRGELLRPPFGVYNAKVRKVAREVGYHIAFWTIDSKDWTGISATEIQKRVLQDMHPGACVLLHLNGPHTLEALPNLIKSIREKGFELCKDSNEISLYDR